MIENGVKFGGAMYFLSSIIFSQFRRYSKTLVFFVFYFWTRVSFILREHLNLQNSTIVEEMKRRWVGDSECNGWTHYIDLYCPLVSWLIFFLWFFYCDCYKFVGYLVRNLLCTYSYTSRLEKKIALYYVYDSYLYHSIYYYLLLLHVYMDFVTVRVLTQKLVIRYFLLSPCYSIIHCNLIRITNTE